MKISKDKLRELIKEELEVVLTNEEAQELFGDNIENQLTEGPIHDRRVQAILDSIKLLGVEQHQELLRALQLTPNEDEKALE
jgi:hypothetical protein